MEGTLSLEVLVSGTCTCQGPPFPPSAPVSDLTTIPAQQFSVSTPSIGSWLAGRPSPPAATSCHAHAFLPILRPLRLSSTSCRCAHFSCISGWVCRDCHSKTPQTDDLTSSHLLSHASGDWKSKVKVPGGWFSPEASLWFEDGCPLAPSVWPSLHPHTALMAPPLLSRTLVLLGEALMSITMASLHHQ